MVKSNVTSITPAQHADRHVIGGADPLIDPLLLHHAQHDYGGTDAVFTGGIPDNDTERTLIGAGATVKKKETLITNFRGSLSISFDAKQVGSVGTFTARIYHNGAPVGTSRTLTTSYVTYTETIADWLPDDLMQVYLAMSAGTTGYVKNLHASVVSLNNSVVSGTAQDP